MVERMALLEEYIKNNYEKVDDQDYEYLYKYENYFGERFGFTIDRTNSVIGYYYQTGDFSGYDFHNDYDLLCNIKDTEFKFLNSALKKSAPYDFTRDWTLKYENDLPVYVNRHKQMTVWFTREDDDYIHAEFSDELDALRLGMKIQMSHPLRADRWSGEEILAFMNWHCIQNKKHVFDKDYFDFNLYLHKFNMTYEEFKIRNLVSLMAGCPKYQILAYGDEEEKLPLLYYSDKCYISCEELMHFGALKISEVIARVLNYEMGIENIEIFEDCPYFLEKE